MLQVLFGAHHLGPGRGQLLLGVHEVGRRAIGLVRREGLVADQADGALVRGAGEGHLAIGGAPAGERLEVRGPRVVEQVAQHRGHAGAPGHAVARLHRHVDHDALGEGADARGAPLVEGHQARRRELVGAADDRGGRHHHTGARGGFGRKRHRVPGSLGDDGFLDRRDGCGGLTAGQDKGRGEGQPDPEEPARAGVRNGRGEEGHGRGSSPTAMRASTAATTASLASV